MRTTRNGVLVLLLVVILCIHNTDTIKFEKSRFNVPLRKTDVADPSFLSCRAAVVWRKGAQQTNLAAGKKSSASDSDAARLLPDQSCAPSCQYAQYGKCENVKIIWRLLNGHVSDKWQ